MRARRALLVGSMSVTTWIALGGVARADNCGSPSDCFFTERAAILALIGIATLGALLVFGPGAAAATLFWGADIAEVVTGRDLLTWEKMPRWQAALGMIDPLPGNVGSRGVRQVIRQGDELLPTDDILRRAGRYSSASTLERRALSEELGMMGGHKYLRDVSGDPRLRVFTPESTDEVADYATRVRNGTPWEGAVTFKGAHATNIVYFDGKTLHVVEAKGGSSGLGYRTGVHILPGERLSQGTEAYLADIAEAMRSSTMEDGRNVIGRALAENEDLIRYVSVRTGGRGDLLSGSARITVEHVFMEPRW